MFIDAFVQSDFFGKLIFLSLLALSVLSWALIVYKAWVTRSVRARSLDFARQFQQHRKMPLTVPCVATSPEAEMPNAFQEIYRVLKVHAVEILKKNQSASESDKAAYLSHNDVELVESHLIAGISRQTQHLEDYLFMLSTTASLAPLLGLLGTVWGILITFSELQGGGSAAGNQMVLGGLATALTTTVLGLVVAIPALVGYMTLRSHINAFNVEMEDFSAEMLGALEMHYRRVDALA